MRRLTIASMLLLLLACGGATDEDTGTLAAGSPAAGSPAAEASTVGDKVALPPPVALPGVAAAALWRPLGGTREAHLVTSWQALATKRSQLNTMQLIDVERTADGSAYAGLWRPTPGGLGGGDVDRVEELDASDLAAEIAAQQAAGYQLVDLEVWDEGGTTRALGLWHPAVPEHCALVGVTQAQLEAATAPGGSVPASGTIAGSCAAGTSWRLVDVETWLDQGLNRHWASLWRDDPELDTYFALVTLDAFAQPGENANSGYLPLDLEVVRDAGWNYQGVAGVWEAAAGSDWWRAEVAWGTVAAKDDDFHPPGDPGGELTGPTQTMIEIDLFGTSAFFEASESMPRRGDGTIVIGNGGQRMREPVNHNGPTLPPPPPPV